MKQSIGDTFLAVCIAAKIQLLIKLSLCSCSAYFVMLYIKNFSSLWHVYLVKWWFNV